MSGACKYCGRPTFNELGIVYHVETGDPAEPLAHEDNDGRVYPPSCRVGTQSHDASYTAVLEAYCDGEYDGYWGRPQREGEHTNTVWVAYLRGYMAGVRDRATEPSNEQIDAFIRNVNEALADDDTPVVEHGYHDEHHPECPLCRRNR